MNYLKVNKNVIGYRWPALWAKLEKAPKPAEVLLTDSSSEQTLQINGLHLTSAYNRLAEADLQAKLIPAESEAAWVYGFSLGDLPRVLLERRALVMLTVIILNPAVAYQSLLHFDHSDWLGDPRIILKLPSTQEAVQHPFSVAPACLRLASDDALNLRDNLILEMATPSQTKYFQDLETELANRILKNLSKFGNDGDVRALFGTNSSGVAMVAAGGPTLGEQFDWIHQNRSGKILVAVSTALVPLQKAGINPDVVVVIDREYGPEGHFDGVNVDLLQDTPLVYFPTVRADLLEFWPGPRLTAYTHQIQYQEINREIPKGFLFCSGTVTHAAVDLAVKMGSRQVVLMGADFCFPQKKRYVDGVVLPMDMSGGNNARYSVLNGHGSRARTDIGHIGFLRDLEIYIDKNPSVSFVNTGRQGATIKGTRWLDELNPTSNRH